MRPSNSNQLQNPYVMGYQPTSSGLATQEASYTAFGVCNSQPLPQTSAYQGVGQVPDEKLSWPVFTPRPQTARNAVDIETKKPTQTHEIAQLGCGYMGSNSSSGEKLGNYYAGVGQLYTPQVSVEFPAQTFTVAPAAKYPYSSSEEPSNEFYHSSTEYGLREKPVPQPYSLTQSLGEAVSPYYVAKTKGEYENTLRSTTEESSDKRGPQQVFTRIQNIWPAYQQTALQKQNQQRPTSSYGGIGHLPQISSMGGKQKPQTPDPYTNVPPQPVYHQPQYNFPSPPSEPYVTPPSEYYNVPPQMPLAPHHDGSTRQYQPAAHMHHIQTQQQYQHPYYPPPNHFQYSSPNGYLIPPQHGFPEKTPSMLRPYAQKYANQQSRLDNPFHQSQSIIERLNGESLISVVSSCVDNLPVLEKIVEYIELLDEFLKNISEFDKQCTSIEKNRSQGLVNFYLFKRCCWEKVRLQKCLRGEFNLFEEVDFLEVTDFELEQFRRNPENRDVLQLVAEENYKLQHYLLELLEAFKSKFKIFPKANVNLHESFEYELCYYLHKEVESIEEALLQTGLNSKDKQQLRHRQAFLYESMFLLEFFNGRFLKYYESYKELPDVRKYLKGHRKAFNTIIMKYLLRR